MRALSDSFEPKRAQDPPMKIPGHQMIMGVWILAKDRWEICQQTEPFCFQRHVLCKGDCNCGRCQAPGGKLWPPLVADRLKPAGWPG